MRPHLEAEGRNRMTDEITVITDATREPWYELLVDDCKAIITEAVFNSRWALVEGYHQLGERIVTETNLNRKDVYGKKIVQGLGQSLRLSESTIYYAIQFYEKYPDLSTVPEGKNISWNKIVTKYLPTGLTPDEKEKIDQLEKLRVKWGVNTGQIWKLGDNRIMCGDSYNKGEREKLISNESINALITDPPYGIGYKPNWNKWDGSLSDYASIIGDNQEFNPSNFLSYPTVVMFGANYFSKKLPIGGWICWDKRLDENKDSMFGSPFELAWFRSANTNKKGIMIRVLHGGVVNADSIEGNNEKRLHATQKPVSVMRKIIEIMTLPRDVIFDPFVGSGSTLLACHDNQDRKCLAIEIDPKYVAVTLERWHKKSGNKPCLA